MSTIDDALCASVAQTLRHGADGWVLSVERLSYVEGSLYRPSTVLVRGRRRILSHLAEAEAPEVCARAETLLAAENPGEVTVDLRESVSPPSADGDANGDETAGEEEPAPPSSSPPLPTQSTGQPSDSTVPAQ